jgi:hypothetical protein
MSSVNTSIRILRELTPDLNKTADECAKLVQDLEEILRELGLGGIDAEGFDGVVPEGEPFQSLAHCRIDGKYRIAVVFHDAQNREKERKPYAECPRDVKLRTFSYVSALIEDILSREQKILAAAQKAKQTLQEILDGRPASPAAVKSVDDAQQPAKPAKRSLGTRPRQ